MKMTKVILALLVAVQVVTGVVTVKQNDTNQIAKASIVKPLGVDVDWIG